MADTPSYMLHGAGLKDLELPAPGCLQEIGEMKDIPSFWVDSAARIDVDHNRIEHKVGQDQCR